MGGVDHEHIDTGLDEHGGLRRHIAVDTDRRCDPESTRGVDGGCVQRGTQGTGAGEHTDEIAAGVDDGGDTTTTFVQRGERCLGIDGVGEGEQIGGHHLIDGGVAVDPAEIGVGDDPDGTIPLDHDDRVVGALGDEVDGLTDGVGGGQGDRCVVHEVTTLDPVDDVGDDLERDVLRDDCDATASGDGLGHATAGDGGHVGDHDGDGGAGAVGGGQVDIEPGGHIGSGRDHEDVIEREVRFGETIVKEAHER